jgi:hypothetical protein
VSPLNNPPAAGAKSSSGSYTGDGAANKAIAHSLGYAPKFVYIYEDRGVELAYVAIINTGYNKMLKIDQTPAVALSGALTAPDATNFYVGVAGDLVGTMNFSGYTYYWVAVY